MEEKILQSLKRSISQLPAIPFEEIAKIPVVPMTEHDAITRQKKRGTLLPLFLKIVPLAAVFLFAVLGYYRGFVQVVSVVEWDVNPSIRLSVNRQGEIRETTGINPHGKEFLENHSYKKKPVLSALEELTEDLFQEDYLKKESTLLLSVESKEHKEGKELLTAAVETVEESGRRNQLDLVLYGQNIKQDRGRKEKAEELAISQGKYALLQQLQEKNPELSIESMAPLSLENIITLAQSQNLQLSLEIMPKPQTPKKKKALPSTDKQQPTGEDTGEDKEASPPQEFHSEEASSPAYTPPVAPPAPPEESLPTTPPLEETPAENPPKKDSDFPPPVITPSLEPKEDISARSSATASATAEATASATAEATAGATD